jgi:hypothetical protein
VHMCQIDFRDQSIHDLLGDLASKRGGAEITWVSQGQELENSSSFLPCDPLLNWTYCSGIRV